MKTKNLVWGISCIIAAIILIGNELDIFPAVGVVKIILTALCAAFLIKGITEINFYAIWFSIGFATIIWKESLDLDRLSSFTILVGAGLLAVGCSLIKPKK